MQIKIWGARGSLPTPGAQTLRYGGNTTCLEVRLRDAHRIVIDAGSGMRPLGNALMQEPGTDALCLMLTHAHWDHLLGFPFFPPAYSERFHICVCGGPQAQSSLRGFLARQMEPPFFPVNLSAMNAEFCFNCHNPGGNCHGAAIDSIPLSHPNGGYGFSFEQDGKRFVFLTDNELAYQHEGGLTRDQYVEVCRGADLLLHDAQYTNEEYQHTRGWGHSTFAQATDLAIAAGVTRFGIFHHDPERTDDALDGYVEECSQRARAAGSALECFGVAEGSVLEP